jgi:putative flippase GtrA
VQRLIAQLLRFGLVGGVGFIVDLGIFNLLCLTVLSPTRVEHGSIYAKIISTVLAIIVNWLGNRYWTFGDRKRPHIAREGLEFALVSAGGLLIGLLCLWVSHYVLGYTSLLADNIATNGIGLVLGTAFRFWLYRVWVFSDERHDGEGSVGDESDTEETAELSESPTP